MENIKGKSDHARVPRPPYTSSITCTLVTRARALTFRHSQHSFRLRLRMNGKHKKQIWSRALVPHPPYTSSITCILITRALTFCHVYLRKALAKHQIYQQELFDLWSEAWNSPACALSNLWVSLALKQSGLFLQKQSRNKYQADMTLQEINSINASYRINIIRKQLFCRELFPSISSFHKLK